MKLIYIYTCLLISAFSLAQNEDEVLKKQAFKATNLIAEANAKIGDANFIEAEMDYRKAISTKPSSVAGTYNLAHSYYKENNLEEALFRNQQAVKNATNKDEKYRAFHNIGNILMQNKECKEAVEAFKNALRNNPKDNETRYNLALAQDCAKDQQKDEKPQEDDKDGDNKKDKEENKDENKKDNNEKKKEQDKQDQEKKEGEDNKDKNQKDKGDKKDNNKESGDKQQQKPKQQKGQLSPQQIKNLLEAMNNEEQKVQEKVNAQKAKGVKVQTDKDW
jgi:tetratricopeptide (TPR) repeat protein